MNPQQPYGHGPVHGPQHAQMYSAYRQRLDARVPGQLLFPQANGGIDGGSPALGVPPQGHFYPTHPSRHLQNHHNHQQPLVGAPPSASPPSQPRTNHHHRSSRHPDDKEKRETDRVRLMQRQKQINFGKNTLSYRIYISRIPKDLRDPSKRFGEHPVTPDIYQRCSKRSFAGQIKKWRRLLHQYDPPSMQQRPESGGHPRDRHSHGRHNNHHSHAQNPHSGNRSGGRRSRDRTPLSSSSPFPRSRRKMSISEPSSPVSPRHGHRTRNDFLSAEHAHRWLDMGKRQHSSSGGSSHHKKDRHVALAGVGDGALEKVVRDISQLDAQILRLQERKAALVAQYQRLFSSQKAGSGSGLGGRKQHQTPGPAPTFSPLTQLFHQEVSSVCARGRDNLLHPPTRAARGGGGKPVSVSASASPLTPVEQRRKSASGTYGLDFNAAPFTPGLSVPESRQRSSSGNSESTRSPAISKSGDDDLFAKTFPAKQQRQAPQLPFILFHVTSPTPAGSSKASSSASALGALSPSKSVDSLLLRGANSSTSLQHKQVQQRVCMSLDTAVPLSVINSYAGDGLASVHRACLVDHGALLRIMIERKANLDLPTVNPMHARARRRQTGLPLWSTPLHIATRMCSLECLKLLLDQDDIRLHALDGDSLTAEHYVPSVEQLLSGPPAHTAPYEQHEVVVVKDWFARAELRQLLGTLNTGLTNSVVRLVCEYHSVALDTETIIHQMTAPSSLQDSSGRHALTPMSLMSRPLAAHRVTSSRLASYTQLASLATDKTAGPSASVSTESMLSFSSSTDSLAAASVGRSSTSASLPTGGSLFRIDISQEFTTTTTATATTTPTPTPSTSTEMLLPNRTSSAGAASNSSASPVSETRSLPAGGHARSDDDSSGGAAGRQQWAHLIGTVEDLVQ